MSDLSCAQSGEMVVKAKRTIKPPDEIQVIKKITDLLDQLPSLSAKKRVINWAADKVNDDSLGILQ